MARTVHYLFESLQIIQIQISHFIKLKITLISITINLLVRIVLTFYNPKVMVMKKKRVIFVGFCLHNRGKLIISKPLKVENLEFLLLFVSVSLFRFHCQICTNIYLKTKLTGCDIFTFDLITKQSQSPCFLLAIIRAT